MSLNLLSNIALADYTSWQVGGAAEFFCMPENIDQMKSAIEYAHTRRLPISIIGGGTNVLVSDQGIRGLTICLKKFSQYNVIEDQNNLVIDCLSGTGKSELLKIFLKYKLAPALFLAGLPGDVGGGVVMNAGVAESHQPREFMELVDWIEVMKTNGTVEHINKSALKIKYRHTDGWQPHIITKVRLRWPLNPDPDILKKVRDANKIRLSKQPLDMPSCGSVFKNPEDFKAAQLIDQCGLKGFQIGDAQVSLKHANFIVNLDKATAKDIWSVIIHVQKTVEKLKNVKLTTEVVRLGDWGPNY